MDYPSDPKNYDGSVSFRSSQNIQFTNQNGASAFSGTSRLLDSSYQQQQQQHHQQTQQQPQPQQPQHLQLHQQRRQGFDVGYQLAGQHSTYGLQSNVGLVSDHSYGGLHMGSYDNGIVDWNNGRSLGVIETQYAIPQVGSAIFQPSGTSQNDWSLGLRVSQPMDSLGLPIQTQQVYAMADISQQQQTNISNGNGMGSISHQHQVGQQRQSRGFIPSQPSGGRNVSNSGNPGTGGSNAQGRALNKMLLDILRERTVDPNRLAMAIDANIERMDCVNLATLLFHTGKKRLLLTPSFVKRIAVRFSNLKEELRAREASNALYGLKCMSSECLEVRQLVFALASKVAVSQTELVAQAVGNALYGCQMMTSEHEEVRYLLQVLATKVSQCTELLEAQNVGNALYGLRGMSSDCKEVRMLIAALTPKIATAREELNGQALGNSLYGLQGMSSREIEVRNLLSVLATKVARTWEDLKAQEVGNALYGLKRMNSDIPEVRGLIDALVPKFAASPEILDAQAIGNSFYGMQNMRSDNAPVLSLLHTMADKVLLSPAELDGQAMGNSLYGIQGMNSERLEVRAVVHALTMKIQASCLEMNAQELGNALYGLQNMTSDHPEIRRLLVALTQKVSSSKHELTSQEIGNAIFGLQGMRSNLRETRLLVRQMALKIQQSSSLIDPQGIANSLFGMQRMTSDYEEVRLLVSALAMKIEQSWKLLGAQHIANGLFGLQGLCSAESEVCLLLHSLVPKILASRDEMNPKQICNALYGLKNMFSTHDEVRSILGPLTEKLNMCSDGIPLQGLSAAFFALQGMDGECEESRSLLLSMCDKLATVDEIDAHSLGNTIYGLQRFSTNCPEMLTSLELLSPMVMALADSGLEISAPVCANIVLGLQNCSCAEESVRRILFVVVNRGKELIGTYTSASPPPSAKSTPLTLFLEAQCFYQALSLALQAWPDLHLDTELQDDLRSQHESLRQIVEARSGDANPPTLSSPERRLAETVAEILADEPFSVTSGDVMHGFNACITIRLRPGVTLQNSDGSDWCPILNIEVAGAASKTPVRELFSRLRAQYLNRHFGVTVHTIPVSLVIGYSRSSLRDSLRRSDVFSCLYPPSEEAVRFSSILSGMGLSRPEGILSSLHIDDSHVVVGTINGDAGASFFSLGSGGDVLTSVDDFCDPIQDDDVDFFDSRMILTQQRAHHSAISPTGWLGDAPKVTVSLQSPVSTPTAQYASPTAHLIAASIAQRRPQGIYKTVVTSPMPPGYSNRIVSPPFVQIGPPPVPSGVPGSFNSSNSLVGRSVSQGNSGSSTLSFKPTQVSYNPPPQVKAAAIAAAAASSARNVGDVLSLPARSPVQSSSPSSSPTQSLTTSAPLQQLPVITSPSLSEGSHVPVEAIKVEENSEVDSEIALLEAQLEIKRLEARLLMLKKNKPKTAETGPTNKST